MRKLVVVIAWVTWAAILGGAGYFLTQVEYASDMETTAVGAGFVLAMVCAGISLGVFTVPWRVPHRLAEISAGTDGFIQRWFKNMAISWKGAKRQSISRGIIASLALAVAILAVLVYQMDQRISELERPEPSRISFGWDRGATIGEVDQKIESTNRRISDLENCLTYGRSFGC